MIDARCGVFFLFLVPVLPSSRSPLPPHAQAAVAAVDDGKTKMSKKAKAAAARAAAAVEHLLPDLRIGKNETDHLRSDQILLVDIQKSKCVPELVAGM